MVSLRTTPPVACATTPGCAQACFRSFGCTSQQMAPKPARSQIRHDSKLARDNTDVNIARALLSAVCVPSVHLAANPHTMQLQTTLAKPPLRTVLRSGIRDAGGDANPGHAH